MRKISSGLVLIAAVALAGCWQSKDSLYGDRQPVEPFRTGRVEGINVAHKDRDHSLLTKEPGGVYRLTNNDKDSSDFGDSFLVRFFPLAGTPAGIFAYEAQEVKTCKPADNMCRPVDPSRYYGLVRRVQNGGEVLNPDCAKDSAAAKLPGVTAGDYGTCDFADRAALEKALLALAKKPWKADIVYTFQ